MSSIIDIKGREILDSRGFPTIEVEVLLASGVMARAAVPSGASTGKYEAIELRDGDKKRYNGKGVLKAVNNINNIICPHLIDFDILNQKAIDEQLIKADGSTNKSVLGANAILGVSLACAKAASRHLGVPFHRYIGGQYANVLPMPMANIINGGSHADGNVDIQEFMIVPIEAKSFKEAVRIVSEIFHTLKILLKKNGYSTSVGDEGGYAPSLKNNEEAIELILQAAKIAKHKVKIALDAAASELVNNAKKKNTYCFWKSTGKTLSSDQMVNYWVKLVAKYPEIISIEDPMGEDDWDGWAKLTKALKGKNIQIVGDDLFVTNPKFLEKGIKKEIANAVLVKVNQIGTLSETIEVIKMAHKNGYATVISHRSGETEDTTIADLAIATNAGQIKTGSVSRSERVAKYNQLIRLEEQLGKLGHFDLKNSFPGIKF